MAWSRFSQIEIDGFRRGQKRNNLYYFSVLRIPGRVNFLAAVFPAAIEGEGGVARRSCRGARDAVSRRLQGRARVPAAE